MRRVWLAAMAHGASWGLMAHGSWLMAIGFFLLSRPTRFPIPHQDRNVDA